jgi:L-amino acid N-acyltransferase YncA
VGRAGLNGASIRAVVPGDLAAISAIFAHYVQHTVATFEETPRSVREWGELAVRLHGLDLPFLVAESGGEVCGYGYASPWRSKPAYRHTAEDSVFVAPAATGRGLGRLLLGGVVDGCARGGTRQLIAVIADTGDPASAALHEAFGFTIAGRLTAVGYKQGRWIDTVLMQRAVSQLLRE